MASPAKVGRRLTGNRNAENGAKALFYVGKKSNKTEKEHLGLIATSPERSYSAARLEVVMQDVQPVGPAKDKEEIREAIRYFREEGVRLVKRIFELKEALGALQVVRAHCQNNRLVGEADFITLQKVLEEARADLELCKKRQDILPIACSYCDGRGTVSRGGLVGTDICSFCNGVGFLEPTGPRK